MPTDADARALAEALALVNCGGSASLAAHDWPSWVPMAEGLLASDWLAEREARIRAETLADAWDQGYRAGHDDAIQAAEHDLGTPWPDPTPNPHTALDLAGDERVSVELTSQERCRTCDRRVQEIAPTVAEIIDDRLAGHPILQWVETLSTREPDTTPDTVENLAVRVAIKRLTDEADRLDHTTGLWTTPHHQQAASLRHAAQFLLRQDDQS